MGSGFNRDLQENFYFVDVYLEEMEIWEGCFVWVTTVPMKIVRLEHQLIKPLT